LLLRAKLWNEKYRWEFHFSSRILAAVKRSRHLSAACHANFSTCEEKLQVGEQILIVYLVYRH